MNKYILKRVLMETEQIINTKDTVRKIAKDFKVSKSTVHKDLQERLLEINEQLHNEVKLIFEEHISTRHIKGGLSTKNKYLNIKVRGNT